MNLELKEVPGFPGYMASACGEIYRGGRRSSQETIWNGYRRVWALGKHRLVHRMVAAAWIWPAEPGMMVDHLNSERADNRAENLRYVTPKQNARRKRIMNTNTHGYPGIYRTRLKVNKWGAQIGFRGTTNHIGVFMTKEAAYLAFLRAKIALHGEESINSFSGAVEFVAANAQYAK